MLMASGTSDTQPFNFSLLLFVVKNVVAQDSELLGRTKYERVAIGSSSTICSCRLVYVTNMHI